MKRKKETICNLLKSVAVMLMAAVIMAGIQSCKNKAGGAKNSNAESALTKDSTVVYGQSIPQDAPPPPPPPPPLPYNVANGDTVWFRVDALPVYPGGNDALFDQISKTFTYPEPAAKKNIQGRVVVGFVVTKECMITDVKVVTGIDPDCDAEAVRVIKSLQQFEKPAMVRGRPVSYHYTVPVSFKLQ